MGYRLHAAIAAEPVLRTLTDGLTHAHLVPLGEDLTLLPLTDAFFDEATIVGAPELEGFAKAPAGFGRVLSECSANGPVACVEADYFGGVGTQRAQVWDGRAVVLGPLSIAEGERLPPEGGPISQALRWLGVAKGDHFDEFDAVGLGRHRDTHRWL